MNSAWNTPQREEIIGYCPYGCGLDCRCWHKTGHGWQHINGTGVCPHHKREEYHTPIGDGVFIMLAIAIWYLIYKIITREP